MASYVVECLSHLAVWAIGLLAAITFVEKFETELKPLVLAFILTSILEAVVQIFEWILRKLWALTKAIIWKIWQILGLLCRQCCCRFAEDQEDVADMFHDIVWNWEELRQKWEGKDAGDFLFIRVLSVLGTLAVVSVIGIIVKSVVFEQVNAAINKFGLYKHQVTSVMAWVVQSMPDLDKLFPGAKDEPMLQHFLQQVRAGIDEAPGMVEGYAVSFLNGIVTSLSGSVMGLAFLLLYTAFLLFDPLHINLESSEEFLKVQRSRSSLDLKDEWGRKTAKRVWRSMWRTPPTPPTAALPLLEHEELALGERAGSEPLPSIEETEGGPSSSKRKARFAGGVERRHKSESGHLLEVQVKVYKIIWNYFLLTFVVNAVYAILNFILFEALHVDLSVILAAFCFFLSFIPELGTIVCMVLPLPFILLTPTKECYDSHVLTAAGLPVDPKNCITDFGARLQTFTVVFTGMLVIKIVVANVLSPSLISRNKVLNGAIKEGHEVSEAHPVIVLFSVVFFGAIWGTVGMFISVPAISVMRMAVNIGREQEKMKKELKKHE